MSKKDYQNSNDHSLTFSVAEAAELLGLSKGNLYHQIRLNAIPCLSIGRRKLIPKAALLQWLEKSGADSKTVESILSLQQEHSPDVKMLEKEDQRETTDNTAITGQHPEEVITKSSRSIIKNVSQQDNPNNGADKYDVKRIADALEEIIDIRKEMDPGRGISPIVRG